MPAALATCSSVMPLATEARAGADGPGVDGGVRRHDAIVPPRHDARPPGPIPTTDHDCRHRVRAWTDPTNDWKPASTRPGEVRAPGGRVAASRLTGA